MREVCRGYSGPGWWDKNPSPSGPPLICLLLQWSLNTARIWPGFCAGLGVVPEALECPRRRTLWPVDTELSWLVVTVEVLPQTPMGEKGRCGDAGGSLLVAAGPLASCNLILWTQNSCRYFREWSEKRVVSGFGGKGCSLEIIIIHNTTESTCCTTARGRFVSEDKLTVLYSEPQGSRCTGIKKTEKV